MSRMLFLYGDLHEVVYVEQPPGSVAQGEITSVSRRLHITSSRVQERSLRSSASPSLALIFTNVTQITRPSFGSQSLWHYSSGSVCWCHFTD